jgi:phosphinothricin acetyltransferase
MFGLHKPRFSKYGFGYQLYKILFQILKVHGYRNVYTGITLPNEASIKLHEKCGFTHFATYENVGYRLGEWKSVGWWKLQLRNYNLKPSPPSQFSELDLSRFKNLFSAAAHHISQKLTY